MKKRSCPIPPAGKMRLTSREVCGLSGFGLTTIEKAIREKRLPAHLMGRSVVIKRADADRFLENLPRKNVDPTG